jgi:hypothetical protein
MNMSRKIIFLTVIGMLIASCLNSVPPEKVGGTYVASYPFGSETLTLDPDGSFIQRVEVQGEAPLTISGTWKFDPQNSYVRFNNFLLVVDGFGHLNKDWRSKNPGIVELSAGRLWFKITLGSGGQHPYRKQ